MATVTFVRTGHNAVSSLSGVYAHQKPAPVEDDGPEGMESRRSHALRGFQAELRHQPVEQPAPDRRARPIRIVTWPVRGGARVCGRLLWIPGRGQRRDALAALRALQDENQRLRWLVADLALEAAQARREAAGLQRRSAS